MAENKIKLSADTKDIRKSLLDLSKDVKQLGSSKVTIFDKEQRDFLTKKAKDSLNQINTSLKQNREEITKALKEQNKMHSTVEDENKARMKTLDLIKKQVQLQKQAQDIGGISDAMSPVQQGGKGPRIPGKARGRGLGALGRLGRAGPVGAALAIGGFAASRGAKAFGQYQGGIEDRISLRGRGVGDVGLKDKERAARAGMNAQDVRRARLTAMDVFGKRGATEQSILQRAEVERNVGIQQGTFTQMGAQMRGAGAQDVDKTIMTIQASLIASGITDEIGPYLETAANMLTQLNENGFAFDDSAMAALTSMVASGMTAERAGRYLTGVDASIKGSTGEANAFFQQVFGQAGIGGGTIGGIQAGIRSGGLFGADLDKAKMLGGVNRQALEDLGIGGQTGQKVAKSTVGMLDKLFGTDEEIKERRKTDVKGAAAQRLQRMDFVRRTFGLENEIQAGEVDTLLKNLAKTSDPKKAAKIQKEIKNLQDGNTELGNLKTIAKSNAGIHQAAIKLHETIQDEFGNKLAPLFTSMTTSLSSIDLAMSSMLDFFGITTAESAVSESKTGRGIMTQDEFDLATGGDPQRQKELSKEMATQFSEKMGRLTELQEKDKELRQGGGRGLMGPEAFEKGRLSLETRNLEQSDTNIRGLNIGTQMSKEDRRSLDESTVKRLKTEQDISQMNPIVQLGELISSMFSDDDSKKSKKSTDNIELKESLRTQKEILEQNKRSTKANEDRSTI